MSNETIEQHVTEHGWSPGSKVPRANMSAKNYVAVTDYGKVGVSIINTTHTGNSAVKRRLELVRIERVIRALEDWLGIALDLEFVDVPISAPHITTVRLSQPEPTLVAVCLPLKSWHLCKATTTPLENHGFELFWPRCHAKLLVNSLTIPDQELALIEEKSTILIPESFQQPWTLNLVIPAIKARLEGHLDINEMTWSASSDFISIDSSEYHQWEPEDDKQEIVSYCCFSTKVCVSDRQSVNRIPSQQISDTGCILNGIDSIDASGVLIPIGIGAGLHITRISTASTGISQSWT